MICLDLYKKYQNILIYDIYKNFIFLSYFYIVDFNNYKKQKKELKNV